MMKRCLMLVCLMLVCVHMACAEGNLAWTQTPELLRPGKRMTLRYALPAGESARLELLGAGGEVVRVLSEGLTKGAFVWDGGSTPPGEYVLRLVCGGETADVPITIGPPAPVLAVENPGSGSLKEWEIHLEASCSGTLVMEMEDGRTALRAQVPAGRGSLMWDCTANGLRLPSGDYDLTLRLVDDTGFSSAAQVMTVSVHTPSGAGDRESFTPNDLYDTACSHEGCYWNLALGEKDEAKVWAALTAPVTVLDGSERVQVKVRREPDASCREYVGEVTCASQAVHVLEKGEEWTLIQAWSSSVEGSSVAVWAEMFTGYVETALLREVNVSQHTGIVVDKLQQRLYVYVDGRLYATLLCSTGYARANSRFNETPAGEFLCVSWTGGFWSGNLFCDMGIRICDGIMLHEVPCLIAEDGTHDYTRCERYLGEKASHGCIRIQREKTPEGVNMKWLWDNLSRPKAGMTKVIIWDDAGRSLDYPDDDLMLYYNPNNGRQYHSDPCCALVNSKFWPLKGFAYAELDEKKYAGLTRCPGCAPQLRKAEIDALNAAPKRPQ